MATEDSGSPPTRAGAVAEQLRRLIQSGEIAPGSRLRQNEVAERFGVSTTPVREAFAELARDGIVRLDAHRGATVFRPSLDELFEIYEIRGALEPLATELAAARATAEELAELEAILLEMRRTVTPARYVELNETFHAKISDMSSRPRLSTILAALRKAAINYIYLTVPQPDAEYAAAMQAQHEEIFEAIRGRHAGRARRAARAHLRTTAQHVTTLVRPELPHRATANGQAPNADTD
jgi:DNA-binding GntR family transcriptional regulator